MTTLKEKVFSRITDDFQVLVKIVFQQLCLTRQLLEDPGKKEIPGEINNQEHLIDSLEVKIRDEVINTIVLYSPRATNLRMIISYYDMTAYLERIGDLLLNIAGFMRKMQLQDSLFENYKNKLVNMLNLTESMTQNAIFAFMCEDRELARQTLETDDQVDELHHQLAKELQKSCSGQTLTESEVTNALNINSISYNLERIGDHATNIAESAIYLMEGKNIKHEGQN